MCVIAYACGNPIFCFPVEFVNSIMNVRQHRIVEFIMIKDRRGFTSAITKQPLPEHVCGHSAVAPLVLETIPLIANLWNFWEKKNSSFIETTNEQSLSEWRWQAS